MKRYNVKSFVSSTVFETTRVRGTTVAFCFLVRLSIYFAAASRKGSSAFQLRYSFCWWYFLLPRSVIKRDETSRALSLHVRYPCLLPSLRVSHDAPPHSKILQHVRRSFSGKCPIARNPAVLGGHLLSANKRRCVQKPTFPELVGKDKCRFTRRRLSAEAQVQGSLELREFSSPRGGRGIMTLRPRRRITAKVFLNTVL